MKTSLTSIPFNHAAAAIDRYWQPGGNEPRPTTANAKENKVRETAAGRQPAVPPGEPPAGEQVVCYHGNAILFS